MKVAIRRWWWVPVLVAVIFLGATVLLSAKNRIIPPEFSEARIEGAKLAQEIVAISSFSLQNLKKIAKFDEEGNATDALILISDEVVKNRELQEKAISLSSQLERMAIFVPQIEPASAQLVATEALTAEVGLVSRLITYNGKFLELFGVLRDKLQYQRENTEGEVERLVKEINEEARGINDLNSKFTDGLAQFDKIFRK